jgi:hypothetical protein
MYQIEMVGLSVITISLGGGPFLLHNLYINKQKYMCLSHFIQNNIYLYLSTQYMSHIGTSQVARHQYSLNQISDDCLTVLWPGDRSGFILLAPALMHLYCLRLIDGNRVNRPCLWWLRFLMIFLAFHRDHLQCICNGLKNVDTKTGTALVF